MVKACGGENRQQHTFFTTLNLRNVTTHAIMSPLVYRDYDYASVNSSIANMWRLIEYAGMLSPHIYI